MLQNKYYLLKNRVHVFCLVFIVCILIFKLIKSHVPFYIKMFYISILNKFLRLGCYCFPKYKLIQNINENDKIMFDTKQISDCDSKSNHCALLQLINIPWS
ncbi:unnamed protein product [Meganyctiphanes norvegica]|uniref:Uncharacterized protein n=1 Tax=Meganyctiphanes norvegica TaxID=48144 RepID=A0AAV2PJF7_MEGNR